MSEYTIVHERNWMIKPKAYLDIILIGGFLQFTPHKDRAAAFPTKIEAKRLIAAHPILRKYGGTLKVVPI